GFETGRPRRLRILDPKVDVLALKARALVGGERARRESRLTADLRAITNPEYWRSLVRGGHDFLDDRCAPGHRARPEVIAVGEPAGNHDPCGVFGQTVLVPDDLGIDVQISERSNGIAVAVRPAKADDGNRHRGATSTS